MSENDYGITPEVRLSLIEQKLRLWRNTAFDAELDVKVAKVIDDLPAQQAAAKRLKDCLKVVAELEEILEEARECIKQEA